MTGGSHTSGKPTVTQQKEKESEVLDQTAGGRSVKECRELRDILEYNIKSQNLVTDFRRRGKRYRLQKPGDATEGA